MTSVLDSELAQAGGYTTVGLSLFINILDWVTKLEVSDALQGISAALASVFLLYKIYNSHLDAKLKRRQLKKDKDAEQK
jgi:hypothetical protein